MCGGAIRRGICPPVAELTTGAHATHNGAMYTLPSGIVGVRWRRLAAFLIGVLCLVYIIRPARSAAPAYYVSTDGSDSNSGTTLGSPFRTIQKCANVARAGDTCFIRGGVYRETVVPGRSGTSSAPITFAAYDDETVTLSGADVVTGWTLRSGRIYRASLSWSLDVREPDQVTNNQVFVDGQMMVEARWPNISLDRVTNQTNSDHARADSASNISQYAASYQDAALDALSDGLFDGGRINFGPGWNMVHTTCDVVSQAGDSVSFQCNRDPAAWNARTNLTSSGDMLRPQGSNYYYLWGKLAALDTPGEWFRESDGNLFLWTPDGDDPSAHSVEARRRLWAFDLSERQYVVIDGLRLFAASIKYSETTSHTTVQNAVIEYPWHVQELPPAHYTNGTDGLLVLGDKNTIRASTLCCSSGAMVNLAGTNNQASNNVIYNAGYMGIGAAIGGASDMYDPNPGGVANNEALHNTAFDMGRLGVSADAGLNIMYNDLYQSHLQMSDGGTIYGYNSDGKGADIAYNLVHDNEAEYDESVSYWGGVGIYLDDDAYNYNVYRNIVWNTTAEGILAYGTHDSASGRLFCHNTVDGRLAASAKSGQTMDGTEFWNNVGGSVSLTGPGLVGDGNYSEYVGFVDRAGHDYRLRDYSPAIDAGIDVGSPCTDSPMKPIGAPDLGALEYGRTPFQAGASVRSLDLPGLEVECAADAGDSSATCDVTGLPIGRQLPADFGIAIGNTSKPAETCVTSMDYDAHRGQATCPDVPTGGLTGVQPIYVRLGDGDWITANGTADLRGFAVLDVTPDSGPGLGGTVVTLTGRRFDTMLSGWKVPVTVKNSSGADLYDHQVLVQLDTATLVTEGSLRSDCSDIGFYDDYGELDFWLEDGCNTASARFWVRAAYVPKGSSTITLYYGHGGRTKATDGHAAFVFFDDFEDGVVSQYWELDTDGFYTAQEKNGKLVLAGTTTSASRYDEASAYLYNWLIPYPSDFAIDSDLTVIQGPDAFKASLGGGSLAVVGEPAGVPPGKSIATYAGGTWVSVGKSTVAEGTFTDHRFSVAFSGSASDRTIRWMENGDLADVLATHSSGDDPDYGGFSYGPDAVASFDARFDNIRVRRYSYPEPATKLGSVLRTGVRVTFDGLLCKDIHVVNATTATCTTPPHPEGWVDVRVANPNGQHGSLENAFLYGKVYSTFLPAISRQ
jgi:hypothetical protein